MSKTLNVYGWTGFAKGTLGRQSRIIVAAPSMAQARRDAELAGVSFPGRGYIGETENDAELAVALAAPGTLFGSLNTFGPDRHQFFPIIDGELHR